MESAGHTESIPFQGRRVEVTLASPGDLLVLTDWCDLVITGDYHFKRRHMQNILERGTSQTWIVLVDGVFSGMLILYRGSMLHNLYLAPDVRQIGLGGALLAHFQPRLVRAKSNMKDGDPVPFYEANGYKVVTRDPLKPHIAIMERLPGPSATTSVDAIGGRTDGAPPSSPPADATGATIGVDAAATIAPALPADRLERKRIQATARSRKRRERLRAEAAAAAAGSASVTLAANRKMAHKRSPVEAVALSAAPSLTLAAFQFCG